jgi:hypothetical protein
MAGQHGPVDDVDAAAAQFDRPGVLQGPQHLAVTPATTAITTGLPPVRRLAVEVS